MKNQQEWLNIGLSASVYKKIKNKCACESISVQDFIADVLSKNVTKGKGSKKLKDQENSSKLNILDLFNECRILDGLSQSELEKLADDAKLIHINKGQIIIREEEVPTSFYIVANGMLKIYKMALSGREFDIDLATRGETFGENTLISGLKFFAEVRAVVDAELVTISKRDFLSLIYRNPKIINNIATLDSIRINNLAIKLIDLISYKSEQRVIKTIKILYSKYGNTLSINHKVIAGLSGVTGETATRALINLKNIGAITLSRGKIQIIDQEKLRF